jgi:hypothetical protein
LAVGSCEQTENLELQNANSKYLVQMRRLSIGLVILGLFAASCSGDDATPPSSPAATHPPVSTTVTTNLPSTITTTVPGVLAAPEVPQGSLEPSLVKDLETLITSLASRPDVEAINRIGKSEDARLGWVLADLLRFVQFGPEADAALTAFGELTGWSPDAGSSGSAWVDASNLLISWDLPAPPGYLDIKSRMFTLVEPRWELFFEETAEIDWRYVSWGGVFIDDRPNGDGSRCPRGCIPALDNPAVTPAAAGSWYPDTSLVFGIVVDDEARAYPKNMMEVHEMVNDTLGGRRLGIPYCTLCGSAQAYLTDEVPAGTEPLLLRTSGLLVRSNKMMFDLRTYSMIDTFRGTAVSGALADQGLKLRQVSVITSTWGEWKAAHPETTILAEDGGIGLSYPADPLRGRDADGPIFPIGGVDPRLPVQAQVLGVETPDGRFVAFPVDQAKAALDTGDEVELAGILLVPDGSGLRPVFTDGGETAGHQAFWFAWSQFHPETLLWAPGFG